LVFDLYTEDRLGIRAGATRNEYGHRAATGARWPARHVLRMPDNRSYLGERANGRICPHRTI
jgi:hypothetical protein